MSFTISFPSSPCNVRTSGFCARRTYDRPRRHRADPSMAWILTRKSHRSNEALHSLSTPRLRRGVRARRGPEGRAADGPRDARRLVHRERVTNHDNGDTVALQSFVGSPRLCHVSESTHRFIVTSAAAACDSSIARRSLILKLCASDARIRFRPDLGLLVIIICGPRERRESPATGQ